jgi:hypothetical protein
MSDTFRGPGRSFTIGQACLARNPHLAGLGRVVGRVAAAKSQPTSAPTLDCADPQQEAGPSRLGTSRYRVALTVFRRRLMDEADNLKTSLKPLLDSIAQSLHGGTLGRHDNLVEWEFGQQKTRGAEGVLVKVERVSA